MLGIVDLKRMVSNCIDRGRQKGRFTDEQAQELQDSLDELVEQFQQYHESR
jgi:uncharacterized coiled-coil DUF342 family protein